MAARVLGPSSGSVVEHRLHVVAVWIEHERRVVALVVLPLAGRPVVAIAGFHCDAMELLHFGPVASGKRDVQVLRQGRALDEPEAASTRAQRDPILVVWFVASGPEATAQRPKRNLVKGARCVEIADTDERVVNLMPRLDTVMNSLDVVAVGVENECAVVTV